MRLALLALAVLAASACGVSRESARERGAEATCNVYEECGLIGTDSGDRYTSRDDCKVKENAVWNDRFPASTCKDIDEEQFDACIDAITSIRCGEGGGSVELGDFINAFLNRCTAGAICSAPDAG